MIGDLKPQKLVYRDGISQSQRLASELDPAYINIEERGLADFVVFAKEFARYLRFYNIDNKISGDWGGFLSARPGSADADQWLANVLQYADDPEAFAGHPEKDKLFSNPHLALFITFLKLLGNIKTQLNQFTKQHLDLYYHELLGLNKKRPVPDVVNIIVELGDDLDTLLFEKGTRLMAGKDSEGKDLIYQTQKDTLLTKSAVANIKTVFVDKRSISLGEKWSKDDVPASIKEMLNMALNYDNFDADVFFNEDQTINTALISSEALKYQLTPDSLALVVDLVKNKTVKPDQTKVLALLNAAYRLRLLHKKRLTANDPSSVFGLLILALSNDTTLPAYDGKAVTEENLDKINDDAANSDSVLKSRAIGYIRMLQLTVVEFDKLAGISKKPSVEDTDWMMVYGILDNALQKKGIAPEVPPVTLWRDISITRDVKATEVGRFQTFGKTGGTIIDTNTAIGFAISSPQFALSEGERSVDLYLSLMQIDELRAANLKKAFDAQRTISPPFRFFIGADGGWNEITGKDIQLKDYIATDLGTDLTGATLNKKGTISTRKPYFEPTQDVGNYIIWTDGTVYRIDTVNSPTNVGITVITNTSVQAGIKKYKASDVYLNTLHIQLNFGVLKPLDALALALPNGLLNLQNGPVLAMVLSNTKKVNNAYSLINWYQQLHHLQIEKIKAVVTVTGIKALSLQNDFGTLNPKTPFEPFGPTPQPGNRFYFSHPELAGKAIDSLNLNFEWMNAPGDFKAYYADYRKVYNNELNGSNKEITGNDYFAADLDVVTNDRPVSLKTIKLFGANDARALPEDYNHIPAGELNTAEDVINWKRYFRLELVTDFNQAAYPKLLAKQAQAYDTDNIKAFNLNTPYVPKLKQFTAGYSSSFELLPGQAAPYGQFFNIGTFGFAACDIGLNSNATLVPTYTNAGELYIGLSGLAKQQNLSILFQMAEGTANPDLPQPTITWSYLKDDQWTRFGVAGIVTDTTRGLLNTGIIEFNIPDDISNSNNLLHENLYWLKASIAQNTTAIPDTIDIITQGVQAIFVDHNNAPSHFTGLLEPENIKKTVDAVPGIKKIVQPFASANGNPEETDGMFYVRVSERLRHKNRALTLWDYERLILAQFPEIYKVKCMPGNFLANASDDIGNVNIIVLPNRKGKFAFDQFQPKVSSDVLLQIAQYLEERIPPFVSVTVRNPVYVMLEVRTGVRIKKGYSEKFYQARLEEDLKKFLSPWAYDSNADIIIGGTVYNNVIVNFIAKLPYVDHVATIRLSQSIAGGTFKPLTAADPDMVLISAPSHDIILLKDDEYAPDLMAGIGYMEIENDFIIPKPTR